MDLRPNDVTTEATGEPSSYCAGTPQIPTISHALPRYVAGKPGNPFLQPIKPL